MNDILPIDIEYNETYNEMEIKLHYHNSYEIIYVLEGEAEFSINGKKYNVSANSMVFINHLESHEIKVVSYPYKRYFILIRPDCLQSVINDPRLSSIFKHRPEYFRHTIMLDRSSVPEILGIFEKMYNEAISGNEFSEITLGAYLQLLAVTLFRSHSRCFPLAELNSSVSLVVQIQKYVEEHYLEQISLKDISKLFYTDMYYLSHLFKKISGFTFKEYLILQRISKARDLLVYTNDDITQVGMNSGFGNVNHFIRIFKKFEGVTPYQYRKRCR